jgi:pyridoxal phosphate enzyme (YggS family)
VNTSSSDDAAARRSAVASNLTQVRNRIARAAGAAGRDPSAVRLVAVSKTFGPDLVRAAAAAGQADFGENKVQEALEKIAACADLDLRWHLIGHLQSNKSRRAAAVFSSIHSIDSTTLLAKVDAAAVEQGTQPELLVQVDLGGEETKFGAPPEDVAGICRAAADCRAVRVVGLMTLPPYSTDPESARPFFRRLRQIAGELRAGGIDPAMVRELSMGMSHDLEVAVEEGATIVRIGTAIFGARTRSQPAGGI